MPSQNLNRIKAVIIASIGGGLEMYDFTIYVFFAPIISALFFPHRNTGISMLETLAVFAVGYFSRPLGAFLFGHYGDTLGRKKSLLITIVLMVIATTLIGLLPTYAAIGMAAPLLLFVLRFLQGIAVGGDLSGAITFVAVFAENNNRGLLCSLIFFGINLGLLIASVTGALLTSYLTHAALTSWGWRVAFLFGIVLGVIGFYLRRKIADTPYFNKLQISHNILKVPVRELFKKHPLTSLRSTILNWLFSIIIVQIFVYMPTYLHAVQTIPLNKLLIINSFNILLHTLCIPIVGYLSDKLSRKKIIISATILFIVLAYPLYLCLNQPNLILIIIALVCLSLLAASITGTTPCALAELFPTNVRYSGVGITYNIGLALFGGTTPLIITYFIYQLHLLKAPSFNLILAAIMTLIAASTMKDMTRKALT